MRKSKVSCVSLQISNRLLYQFWKLLKKELKFLNAMSKLIKSIQEEVVQLAMRSCSLVSLP